MEFRIDSKHRLTRKGRLVERVMSPAAHTSGTFSVQPKIIVMHYTYGGSGRSSAEWFRDPANRYKSSAHVVVDRDGSVIQCVDFNTAANHAGRSSWGPFKGLNRHAYGIELANWGYLQKRGSGWTSYTGLAIADPVLAIHKNGNPNGSGAPIGWEPFPAALISTATQIARALTEAYGVTEIVGHDDISVGRKWDPGPAFDMDAFRADVLEDMSADTANLLRSHTPSDTLNLRSGPGMNFAVLEELPEGTLLSPQQYDANWVLVHVLKENGTVGKTGWVFARLTIPAG